MTSEHVCVKEVRDSLRGEQFELYCVWVVERTQVGKGAAATPYLACREQLAISDQSWRGATLVAEGFNRTSFDAPSGLFAVVVPATQAAKKIAAIDSR